VKYQPPQPQSYAAETAALITRLKERIKQLEEENDAMRADLLLWNEQEVKP
jgi:hypothetical protein